MTDEATKLPLESANIVNENITKLGQLFPEIMADGKIDFDKLREVLGDSVDDGQERYAFTWPGKRDAIRQSQTPSTATLRPQKDKSVDWDTTKNLYIEGDNLEVLKLLQRSYHGKVKMIYIDPPYNTGNDFVYKDSFSDSLDNYKQQTGQASSANPETDGRYHSNWCNMMYPRLRLARELLSEDGVIFISIDDHELHTLRKIGEELFGEGCFVADISWQRTYSPRNDAQGIPLRSSIYWFGARARIGTQISLNDPLTWITPISPLMEMIVFGLLVTPRLRVRQPIMGWSTPSNIRLQGKCFIRLMAVTGLSGKTRCSALCVNGLITS